MVLKLKAPVIHRVDPISSAGEQHRRAGYTLVEIIVVLIILTVAAAVVAPSLFVPRREHSSTLRVVVGNTREVAVRRGEMVRLRIDRNGSWQAAAAGGPEGELLMAGQLSTPGESDTDLLFSPLGTCAPPPESSTPPAMAGFDPLTCDVPSR